MRYEEGIPPFPTGLALEVQIGAVDSGRDAVRLRDSEARKFRVRPGNLGLYTWRIEWKTAGWEILEEAGVGRHPQDSKSAPLGR